MNHKENTRRRKKYGAKEMARKSAAGRRKAKRK